MMQLFQTSRLSEIFPKLSVLVNRAKSYELSEDFARIRQTYFMTLQFLAQGADDPNAGKICSDLLTKTYIIHDRAERCIRLREKTSEKYVLSYQRLSSKSTLSLILQTLVQQAEYIEKTKQDETLEESRRQALLHTTRTKHETTAELLFESVWTSDVWSESDYETCVAFLQDSTPMLRDKGLLISAVTVALLEMFDENKLLFLMEAYLSTHLVVNQRALVGLVLALRLWSQRLEVFPKSKARLYLLQEDQLFVENVFRCLMQLQYSKLTDSISSKVRQDLMPSILSIHKYKRAMGLKEMNDYMTQHGENPEWHHAKEEEKMRDAEKSMAKMAKLLLDGADVYLVSFRYMKGYPFFHSIAHWFTPFDPDCPLTSGNDTQADNPDLFIDRILHTATICDSDLYSFKMMLRQLNIHRRGQLKDLFSEIASPEEVEEAFGGNLKPRELSASEISRFYIFDLYRFFQLYPYHIQFHDPFGEKEPSFSPLHTTSFAFLLQHPAQMNDLADFFMRKGLYADACSLFQSLNPQPREEDADCWQRIGFCEQKQGLISQAYEHYSLAYKLNPQSSWTLSHLTDTAFQLGNYSEALTLNDLLLADAPDNVVFLKRKCACHMKEHRYAEALPTLYKLTYIDESDTESLHTLASCQLACGQKDKARDIAEQLIANHIDESKNLLLLGGIHLAARQIGQAYHAFSRAYDAFSEEYDDMPDQFETQYDILINLLRQSGTDVDKADLLYDAVVSRILDKENTQEDL